MDLAMRSTTAEQIKPHWDDVVRWARLCTTAAERWWLYLQQRHSEPQRAYHTLNHLAELVKHFADIDIPPEKGGCDNRYVILLTIFFHDLVYDPKRGDNEELSAQEFELFVEEAKSDTLTGVAATVSGIIRATKHHTSIDPKVSSRDMNFFLDMDLGILGSSEARYDQYAREIAFEYQHYPPKDYCAGRSAVLQKFADACGKPPLDGGLYKTDLFHKKFASIARRNLEREIQQLQTRLSELRDAESRLDVQPRTGPFGFGSLLSRIAAFICCRT